MKQHLATKKQTTGILQNFKHQYSYAAVDITHNYLYLNGEINHHYRIGVNGSCYPETFMM